MKKRLLAGLIALSLTLTGCASLLNREYSEVTPHNTAPTADGDPSVLRAESYQELVNALLYFVTTGAETGTIRLYLDSENVGSNLEEACLEVVQEDPFSAYAVDFIKYSVNSVVTYSEAEVQITYRRTRDQIASIVSATGITAIRSELESAMEAFAPECVLRISYFDGDEDFIRTLARQAYYNNPAAALGFPELDVSIYPESGRQRIVEVTLNYQEELTALEEKQLQLEQRLQTIALAFLPSADEDTLVAAARAITDASEYDPEGASTPYDALVGGSANSEGLALAYAALCETLELPCHVVEGTRNDAPHFWNLINTESGWRHVDLSTGLAMAPFLYVDQELVEEGYLWDTASYPQSGSRSAE